MTMLPKSAHAMREPEAPGVRLGAGLKTCGGPNPGAVAPYVSLVFMITVGRFSWKENRQDHLGSGGTPAAFLLPFVLGDKRKWPAGQTHSINYDFLCAHAAIKHRLCFVTSFLHVKKGCKETSGGQSPLNPQVF